MVARKVSKGSKAGVDTLSHTIPESFIDQFIDRPGAFVVPNAAAREAAMDIVSKTYDAANFSDKFGLFDDWKAVAESGFDSSLQLWELINIRNQPVLKYSTDIMKELSALVDSVNIGSGSESGSDDEDGDLDMLSQSGSSSEAEESDVSEDEQDTSDGGVDLSEDSDAEKSAESVEEEEDEDEEDEDEDTGISSKRSVVDDDFFSLAEMERFADEAEEEDMRDRAILAGDYPKPKPGEDEESGDSDEDDDDDDIDLFQNFDDDDDDDDMDDGDGDIKADEMKYADFFRAPKGSKRGMAKASREKHAKKVKFDANLSDSQDEHSETEDVPKTRQSNLFDDDEDDNDEGSADGEQKSEFEKRQEKLQNLINKLEDEAVEKKDWAMTGEVSSGSRPKNSLLAEDLEFDHVQKPVPVITQEVTQTLEDVIKQRILNEEWDDVERKKDIQQKPFKPSGFVELDDKQSKKSLAEVYEAQYVAEKSGDAYVPEDDAKVAEAHKAVDNQFRNLFTQLDALSHFHFAPRPAVADIEIRTSAPALQMEEKLPVNMSHAEQLAPEEIYEKSQGRNGRTGDLMGETELTREERKRRRNKKKNAQRKTKADKPAAAAAAKSSTNVKTATSKDKNTIKK
ncbi:U3 snoRNP protein [Coemansia interrupta]|uniref:U3 small nucleolar ribonucleoprotein protein MPP10 n=1 Tax=Coemansia interrupta TaxID=1126814 RepID=A0A9W8HNI2_9FUNG|nr:U3 snoRNP protein [Coemansia interrupta]